MTQQWITLGPPMADRPPLHPRHGPHVSKGGTPARLPGSMRRTLTTDMVRPDGITGRLVLQGRGRDLRTEYLGGRATVLAETSLRAIVEFGGRREVSELESHPAHPALQLLLGVSASTGFRGAVDTAVPDQRDAQTLLYALLDDVPVTTLVSGYALGHEGVRPASTSPLHVADLCAGFRSGGTIMIELDAGRHSPIVTGQEAPPLLIDDEDPLAWHHFDPLPGTGMRRHRRLDLNPPAAPGGPLRFDVQFRDSHMSRGGVETVVHEYYVAGTIDPVTLTISAIEATAGSLPWTECPEAAASAQRLVGASLAGLRPMVRTDFVGPPTCTHLNDTLRSLDDVQGLVRLMPNPEESK
ncbi:MAG: DUF2889 domain-containing protein [Actinomycetota bacterium]|nr:DUF2889 domain-containing protein [Actinomycetota bacterium]